MGVESFLKRVLDSAGNEVDLRRYRDGITVNLPHTRKRKRRNLRIGVDASHWIYKACYRFSAMLGEEKHLSNYGRYQLVQQQQQQTEEDENDEEQSSSKVDPERERHYVTSCCLFVMERLQSLQHETNADILVVLDGATPPIKLKTVQKRSLVRKENAKIRDAPIDVAAVSRTLGQEQDLDTLNRERLKANRRAGAGQYYSDVIEELLMAMRTNEIAFLVAPYEADGQLAYMSNDKLIDIVITEDSDLVAQGGLCMLYKMDISVPNSNPYRGPSGNNVNNVKTSGSFPPTGILLQKDDLGAVTISHKHQNDKTTLSLMDMSDALLAVMFVAAGSDYCEKLSGIGLVTACSIVQQCFLSENTRIENSDELFAAADHQHPPLVRVFDLLFQSTYDRSIQGDLEKQRQYKANFLAALLMYRHPVVFDPFSKQFVVRNEGEGDPELISYPPYRKLLEDPIRRAQIIGDLDGVDKSTATLMAEGWISPRTREIYSTVAKSAAGVSMPKALKLLLESQKAGRDSQEDSSLTERPVLPKDRDSSDPAAEADGDDVSSKAPQVDVAMDDSLGQFASAEDSPEKTTETRPEESDDIIREGAGGLDSSSSQESVQYDTQMPIMNEDIETQEALPVGGTMPLSQTGERLETNADNKHDSDQEQGLLSQQESDGEVVEEIVLETQQDVRADLENSSHDPPDEQVPDSPQQEGQVGSALQTQEDVEVIELLDSSSDDDSYEIDFVKRPEETTKTE